MSRSNLLAGLFLILGAVDLVLLNVWLVPAAWPPSSGPIAMPTTLAEVEETSVERSMVPAEAAAPQQGPAVVLDFADTAVESKEEAERTAAPSASLSTAPVESNSVPRDSGKTEQAAAEPEYRIVHHAVVRFNSDGDSLRSADRDILGEAIRLYTDYPDAEIQVDGHTDNRGRAVYNDRLSERRARAVAGVLEAEGISSGRIQIRGHGSSQPLDSKNSAAARAKNRRVEITIRSRLP